MMLTHHFLEFLVFMHFHTDNDRRRLGAIDSSSGESGSSAGEERNGCRLLSEEHRAVPVIF